MKVFTPLSPPRIRHYSIVKIVVFVCKQNKWYNYDPNTLLLRNTLRTLSKNKSFENIQCMFPVEQILRLEEELTRRRSDSKTTDVEDSNVDVEEVVSEQKQYKESMDLLEKQHAEEIEKLKTECAKQIQDKEVPFQD